MANEPRGPQALVPLFIAMQTFGWIGSTMLLLTVVLSCNVRRHMTWINFCLSWILSGLSYSLLFLGGQLYAFIPSKGLCLTQASLIYTAPALTAGTTLALAIHLWSKVHLSVSSTPSNPQGIEEDQVRNALLVVLPYMTPVTIFIWALMLGNQDLPSVVKGRSGMYCSLNTPAPGKLSAIFVAVTMVITIGIEFTIGIALYKHWRTYTRNSRDSLTMVIRLMTFSLFGVFAIAISLYYLTNTEASTSVSNIMMAVLPVVFVVAFGSQIDIISVWMFWKPRRLENPPPSPPPKSFMQIENRKKSWDLEVKRVYLA